MPNGPGQAFFELISNQFENSEHVGTVQFLSDDPREEFCIEVTREGLTCTDGVGQNPQASITMHNGVICDLVRRSERYDARVIEFSSRLVVSGDHSLASFLLDLVKRPSARVIQALEAAKSAWTGRTLSRVENVPVRDAGAIRDARFGFRPIIVVEALEGWKVSEWGPATLEKEFGKYQVVSYLPWTLRDYANPGPRYTNGVGLPGVLWRRFRPPEALSKVASLGFPQLWLGNPTSDNISVSSLHYDCVHGFLCQVYGTKRILLYSPDQEALVYPRRAFNMFRACHTGPDRIDYERYPMFRQARPVEVLLSPGETLFIPLGWFHCVYASTPVMSISYPVEAE